MEIKRGEILTDEQWKLVYEKFKEVDLITLEKIKVEDEWYVVQRIANLPINQDLDIPCFVLVNKMNGDIKLKSVEVLFPK